MKNDKVKWSWLDLGKWWSEEQFEEKVPKEIREELAGLWTDVTGEDEWDRIKFEVTYFGGYKFTMWTEWVDLDKFGKIVNGSNIEGFRERVVRTFKIEEDERA